METLDLTKRNIRKLKHFQLEEFAIMSEAKFFYKPKSKEEILKIYNFTDEEYLQNKYSTIMDLMGLKSAINIEELVIPTGIVRIDDAFKGIILPKVDGCNTSVFLKDSGCPLGVKIDILKQIGAILKKIRNTNPDINLAFGDVHPDNFIYTPNGIKAIDTDGMQINNNQGRTNFYIVKNPWIKETKSFNTFKNGMCKPTKETDLFCFIMMILQVLSNKAIYKLSLDDYKKYLDYLSQLGFNSKLLDSFASIYKPNQEIIDPLEYLDTIPNSTLNKKNRTL